MKSIFVVFFLFIVVGCDNPVGGGARDDKDYLRQVKEYDSQARLVDEQLKKNEEQIARFDKLLERWEKQTNRYDSLLEKWEKQSARPK